MLVFEKNYEFVLFLVQKTCLLRQKSLALKLELLFELERKFEGI